MPTDRYLSWALDTEADDEREVFLSGIHPLLVDDDLALCEKLERVAAAVQGAVHDDEPPRSCDMGAAPFDEVRLEPSSSDDGGDDDFVDAVRRQCPEDSVSFHHDGDLWAEDGDGPPPEPWLPGLERLTVGVAEGCEEKGGEDSEAGGIGISGEPADIQGSASDRAGRVLEPMDCVPAHPSALGCFLAPEAVEEVVVPHAAKEAPSGPKDCVSASLEQLPSREKCAVVDNECGDFPLKAPCFEDSLRVEPLVESAADESPRSDTSAGYTLINQLFQEDPLQEDFPQEVSSQEGPLLESPPPESLLPREPSQEGSLQEDGSLKHPARRDPLLGDPCLQLSFSGDPPLEHSFQEDPSLEHPLQGDSSLQHPPPEDSFVGGPFPDYPFLGDPLLEQPLLGHPLLEGPSYFETSTLDKSLLDIPSDDSSLGGTSADDSASESEDASPEEAWRDESSLETSLLEDDSLESPSLHDVSQETPSPESSSREDLSDDEFCGKPVRGPSTLKVAATPLPPVSMAVSAPFCLAPVYGTASPGLTATPVYFMLLPDGRGSSGMSADKAVACPAPSSQLCSDSRPAPPPSQPAPPGNAWDTMRVLVPLAGRRQAVRRRPALRCGPPQRTYEGAARRAPAAAHRNKQVTTRTAQEQWCNAGKKLPQPWEGTVSLPRTPVITGGPARSNADSAVAKNRWMRRRPAKPEVPLVPRQLARCGRCDVCSKSYKRLDKHMLIHLQLRRYECPVCGLRFTQSEHCKRHQQKHAETMDPLRKCECTVCGKVLSRRDKLKDHERHAHGRHSQPAACD